MTCVSYPHKKMSCMQLHMPALTPLLSHILLFVGYLSGGTPFGDPCLAS